jgi:hypothetical protein
MLEIKVILAYILTNFEYEISDEILNKEGIGFAIGTHFKFDVKVKSKI